MPNNSRRVFHVITEAGRNGFISKPIKKYWDAVKLAREIALIGEVFHWNELDKICLQLMTKEFATYTINGNRLYFDNYIWVTTDGQLSVGIIQDTNSKFCGLTFMKERENHSTIFYAYSQIDNDLFREFPTSLQIAN